MLEGRLAAALHRLNPQLPHDEVEQVVRTLSRPPHPTLIQNNRWFHEQLTGGVEVGYRDPATGEMRGGRARLVDFDDPAKNDLLVVRQLTIAGPSGKTIRPDLTVFLNGLPMAMIELKDPADTQADLPAAIDQLRRYMERRAGPVRAERAAGCLRRAADAGRLDHVGAGPVHALAAGRAAGEPTLEALIRGLFEPARLLDYLRSCVVFEEDERGNIVKKIAGYHQFRAVRKTRASVLKALKPPAGAKTTSDAGKGGVVWHTQGSGKSLTMLMLAGALVREPAMANPTIVIVTDRNDLDNQLFDTFAAGQALLASGAGAGGKPRAFEAAARPRRRRRGLYDDPEVHRGARRRSSERANIVVMADEAHRSQYGFVDGGGAKWMRDALPNATFVGFTGTPLDRDDRSTPRVFGEYADVYDIRQAVEDGATKPMYYEPRIVKLTVDEAGAKAAEAEIERRRRPAEDGDRDAGEHPHAARSARRRAGALEARWRSSSWSIGKSAAPRWKARRWS